MPLLISLARERLLHFVLLGAAMFGLDYHLGKESQGKLTRITITEEQVRNIASNYRLQYGRSPTLRQTEALVDNFVRAEIFYRQALKLGLDADDEIVRRRLVQKFEFLQQDLSAPPEPTDSALLNYYHQHSDRYLRPETVTFTHIYFSPDSYGESEAREAAQALADQMNRQGVSQPASRGNRFPGASDYAAVSYQDLVRVFGRRDFAAAIFQLELGHWSAPVRSGFGWHTVFVIDRKTKGPAPFNEVRQNARLAYIEGERNRLNAEAFAKLRREFEIVRE